MARVHPTAVVESGAELGHDVVVGPFCFIGPHVSLGSGSVLQSHVVVTGHTRVGENAAIFPFASVGHQPQDLKFRGEESRLVIGRNVIIRENVTINPGTEGGGHETAIGDHCALLAGAHVAHDCRIGSHVILVNAAMIAGHCTVGDHVILGGNAVVHQWVRIGAHAFVGGASALENDLIPFGTAIGNRAHLGGLNLVGLKRRGFPRDDIHALRRAYRLLFASRGTLRERADEVAAAFPHVGVVQDVVGFIRAGGDRAICTPQHGETVADAERV